MVRELENGMIDILKDNELVFLVKLVLCELVMLFNISIFNSVGNFMNIRQFGSFIIKVVKGEK